MDQFSNSVFIIILLAVLSFGSLASKITTYIVAICDINQVNEYIKGSVGMVSWDSFILPLFTLRKHFVFVIEVSSWNSST